MDLIKKEKLEDIRRAIVYLPGIKKIWCFWLKVRNQEIERKQIRDYLKYEKNILLKATIEIKE